MRPGVLYRFYATDGLLLYIGITCDPTTRWAAHSRGQPWWSEVGTIRLEHHPDRASVEHVERRAIALEQPIYNVLHTKAGGTEPAVPSDMPAHCSDCDEWEPTVYYPFTWWDGMAAYRCTSGHNFEKVWPVHYGTGEAPEKNRRPV